MGRRLPWARAMRTAAAATPGSSSARRGSGVIARAVADPDRGCRAGRRRHLGRRVGGGLFFGLLHAGLERLDALGKVAHDAGNLALAAKQQHAHANNDQPMPYAKRTHYPTPDAERADSLTE